MSATLFTPPEHLITAAKVIKTYGTEGELIVKLTGADIEDLKEKEPVFIDIEGLPVPFLITSARPKGETQAILKLTPITPSLAEETVGADIRIKNPMTEYDGGEFDPYLLEGFTVISDSDKKAAGKITAFLDYPGNPCVEIETENGTAILPLADELITDFNPEEGKITLIIPEGLI